MKLRVTSDVVGLEVDSDLHVTMRVQPLQRSVVTHVSAVLSSSDN